MADSVNSFDTIDLHSEGGTSIMSDAELGDVDDKSLRDQIRVRYSQDTRFRKHLARWVMWIVPVWLALVIIILLFDGLNWITLDSSVLISLLATTTVNVLGLAYIVLKGIFNQK